MKIFNLLKKNLKLIIWTLVVAGITAAALWQVTIGNMSPAKKELKQVKAAVEKLMLLPKDEEPTLAAVEDKTKLKDKFLAAKSADGDQVLIYTKNQMAIIYRPSINKIVAVGTVAYDPAFPEAKGASLTVLDSINNPAKAQKIIEAIRINYPDIKITDGGKSNRQDFPDTIIIDNTDKKDYLVDALVEITAGKRGVLPLSEVKTATDLLIIVGLDQP